MRCAALRCAAVTTFSLCFRVQRSLRLQTQREETYSLIVGTNIDSLARGNLRGSGRKTVKRHRRLRNFFNGSTAECETATRRRYAEVKEDCYRAKKRINH